jgi:hypothetical protein
VHYQADEKGQPDGKGLTAYGSNTPALAISTQPSAMQDAFFSILLSLSAASGRGLFVRDATAIEVGQQPWLPGQKVHDGWRRQVSGRVSSLGRRLRPYKRQLDVKDVSRSTVCANLLSGAAYAPASVPRRADPRKRA